MRKLGTRITAASVWLNLWERLPSAIFRFQIGRYTRIEPYTIRVALWDILKSVYGAVNADRRERRLI